MIYPIILFFCRLPFPPSNRLNKLSTQLYSFAASCSIFRPCSNLFIRNACLHCGSLCHTGSFGPWSCRPEKVSVPFDPFRPIIKYGWSNNFVHVFLHASIPLNGDAFSCWCCCLFFFVMANSYWWLQMCSLYMIITITSTHLI